MTFYGDYGNEYTALPREHEIHAKPVCSALKKQAGGYARCCKCRAVAMRKAINMQKRLERGKELLEQTTEKVVDIAFRLGFQNVTYFNRLFKEAYSVSPSVYRRKYKLKVKIP